MYWWRGRAESQALDAADAPVSFRGGAGRAIEVALAGGATSGDFALRGFAPLETALGVARGAWVTVFDATGARSGRARAAELVGAGPEAGDRPATRHRVDDGGRDLGPHPDDSVGVLDALRQFGGVNPADHAQGQSGIGKPLEFIFARIEDGAGQGAAVCACWVNSAQPFAAPAVIPLTRRSVKKM